MNIEKTGRSPVIVIGGGFAGLIAATELKRNGVPFILFEGGKNIGGLAQTFTDEGGFKYDLGTHIITNRLARELDIESECRDVPYFGESIWLKKRSYTYPFGLFRKVRYLTCAIGSRLKRQGKDGEGNLAERFTYDYGKKLAREVAIPLAEGLTGVAASELASGTGDKLPGVMQTLYLRAGGLITRRAVAIGYCMELPESWKVWHVYPVKGIGILCQKLAEEVHMHIRLNSPVSRIFVEQDEVTGIQVDGEFMPAGFVISTAPVNILPQLIEGSDRLNYLHEFQYSGMVCVTIMCIGKRVLPNAALWTPESRFPFFRLTEPSYSMPWLSPEGKSIITADIGCKTDSADWSRSDEEWLNAVLPPLQEIIPDIAQRFLGYKVLKTKYGYPTYLMKYEKLRQEFLVSNGISGLFSIGRNGEFSHLLMEDVYVRTKKKIKEVIAAYKCGN